MAAAPFHDSVLQLAHAPDTLRGRALLRAATELYVASDAHTRTEQAVFEELALQLLKSTPVEDRRAVAALLSRQLDTPATVVRALITDNAEVAAEILAGPLQIAEADLIHLVAVGSVDHLAHLARRPHLAEGVVEALVRRMPVDVMPVLLANRNIRIPEPQMALIRAAARVHPAISNALADRHDDVEDADLTDFFLDLDQRGRRRVIQALEIMALRDFAARRPAPVIAPPSADQVARIARIALSRDPAALATELAELVNVTAAIARRLVDDAGGEPLAIALKAAGLDAATTTRLLLFTGQTDSRTYFEVKRMIELYESVSTRSAVLLVQRWRDRSSPVPVSAARYMPQSEAGTPVRSRETRPDTRAQPVAASLIRRESL